MPMFDKYRYDGCTLTPTNLRQAFPRPKSYTKLDPTNGGKPFELYNSKGQLEGYTWNYLDTVNLEFILDGEIQVESDAIVYRIPGEHPSSKTPGYIEQKAYNLAGLQSWVCLGMNERGYVWVECPEFHYPEDGGETVFVSASDYLKDKEVVVTFYNFRYEPILVKTFDGASKIIVSIGRELSETFKKGIYYCSLVVVGIDTRQPVFGPDDCKLLVK